MALPGVISFHHPLQVELFHPTKKLVTLGPPYLGHLPVTRLKAFGWRVLGTGLCFCTGGQHRVSWRQMGCFIRFQLIQITGSLFLPGGWNIPQVFEFKGFWFLQNWFTRIQKKAKVSAVKNPHYFGVVAWLVSSNPREHWTNICCAKLPNSTKKN